MALEDFEKELAEKQMTRDRTKRKERRSDRHRGKDKHDDPDRRRHDHDSSSHRHRHRHRRRSDEEDERDEKRRNRERHHRHHHHQLHHHHRRRRESRSRSRSPRNGSPHSKDSTDRQDDGFRVRRDAWMEAPLDIDNMDQTGLELSMKRQHERDRSLQGAPPAPPGKSLESKFEASRRGKELNRHLRDVNEDDDEDDEKGGEANNGKTESLPATRTTGALDTHKISERQQSEVRTEQAPALDATALNHLKARMMKAKLHNAPDFPQIEAEYNAAVNASSQEIPSSANPDTVVLGVMDNRLLAGPRNEVKTVRDKKGPEKIVENEDMTVDDMVREERRTKGVTGGEGHKFAERIARDAKFDNDLDYIDENAEKLARRAPTNGVNLRNTAINDYKAMSRILDSCPLCYHEDKDQPPIAPVISLATRTYLTLATEPVLSTGSTMVIPLEHHTNLLECDDDEWEEIRNFMKSLARLYYSQGRGVIFYENAVHPPNKRRLHAGLTAVPVPLDAQGMAPAFFREAILGADEEWTQHGKVIDTLSRSKERGWGRNAFRRSLAKEMPYFHVWFEIDGGMGHVVEDMRRWPRGDLFAREVIGGMLDLEVEVIRKQGRWTRNDLQRVEPFRKEWDAFDWSKALEG